MEKTIKPKDLLDLQTLNCYIIIPSCDTILGYIHSITLIDKQYIMHQLNHRCSSLEGIWGKQSSVRSSVQWEFAMIFAFYTTMSCMSTSPIWLRRVLTSSRCAGSFMFFLCTRMLRWDEYFMRGIAEVGE